MQDDPIQSMYNTKKLFNDKKEIICFHGYQSFEGYEVEPEIAHQIGVELANRLWGDKFEVVVATHTDTSNVHNHYVLNSTSLISYPFASSSLRSCLIVNTVLIISDISLFILSLTEISFL